MDHCLMASSARLLGDLSVSLRDLDRFVESAEREVVRMPKTVPSLRRILSDHIRRRVAVVTGSYRFMARFQPAIVLVVHYVAVSTGGRIVAQIGCTFAIPERVQTNAHRKAKPNAHYDKS
jgi:hypothetical protein